MNNNRLTVIIRNDPFLYWYVLIGDFGLTDHFKFDVEDWRINYP